MQNFLKVKFIFAKNPRIGEKWQKLKKITYIYRF